MNHNLKEIFDKNYSKLCNYAFAIVMDRYAAEEVVQSVFIALWENKKIFQLENPETYLLQCVKFKCIDHLRYKSNKKEIPHDILPETEHEIDFSLSEDEITPLFEYFVSSLPSRMKEVFLMSRVNGMTYKEIAEELKVSVKTIENHMGVALKRLRDMLTQHGYLPTIFFLFFSLFK